MTPPDPVRVLVADDHMVVRAGLSQVLREIGRFDVVAEAESGEQALLDCRRLTPDVVVIDVMMPGMGGRSAVKAIRHRFPGIRIVALSAFGAPRLHDQLFEAGADAFLSKSVSAEDLVDAIRRLHAGLPVAASAPQPAPGETPGDVAGDASRLGVQQRRVLALLTKGCTNGEIAQIMGISLPTARYHVSALLVKLAVSNRAEAAALAIRRNLICESDF